MDERLPLEQLAATLRDRPFAVDAGIAVLVGLVTVVAPASSHHLTESLSFLVGVALVAPPAWRRRAPVPAAAVVTAAGL